MKQHVDSGLGFGYRRAKSFAFGFEVGSEKKGLVWSERVWFGDPPTSSLSSVDFFLSVDGLELFE